jgi:hypothetical protein
MLVKMDGLELAATSYRHMSATCPREGRQSAPWTCLGAAPALGHPVACPPPMKAPCLGHGPLREGAQWPAGAPALQHRRPSAYRSHGRSCSSDHGGAPSSALRFLYHGRCGLRRERNCAEWSRASPHDHAYHGRCHRRPSCRDRRHRHHRSQDAALLCPA